MNLPDHHRLALTVTIQSACEYVTAETLAIMTDDNLIACAAAMAGVRTSSQLQDLFEAADQAELRFRRVESSVTRVTSELASNLTVLEQFRMYAPSHKKHLLTLHEHDQIVHASQSPLRLAIRYTVMVRQSRTRDQYKTGIRTFELDEHKKLIITEFTPEQLNPTSSQSGELQNTQTFIKAGSALWRDLILSHTDQVWQKMNAGTQAGTRREQKPLRRNRSTKPSR